MALRKARQDNKGDPCIIFQSITEKIVVPIFFSSTASIVAYSVIGLTSEFDAIYTYCLFANACLIYGFVSQATFHLPICFMYVQSKISTQPSDNLVSSESSDNEISSAQNKLFQSFRDKYSRFCLFNFLFLSKIKRSFILACFFAYLAFNIVIICHKFTINLPIVDFIPTQSFLKEFMQKHMDLFNIGPIITIAFLKPVDYWEPAVFDSIKKFKTDAMSLPLMNKQLSISWLDDLSFNARANSDFFSICRPPLKLSCFEQTFTETVTNFDFYKNDAILINHNDSFQITASRFYLSMGNFTGNLNERDLMHNLKQLSDNQASELNLTSSDLIVYSPVYIYLEQLDELLHTFLSILVISIESFTIISFFFLLDLPSIFFIFLINLSLILSTVANLILMGFTLNIVTVYNFLLLPALLNEFLIYSSFLFLANKASKCIQMTVDGENKSQIVSPYNESEMLVDDIELKSSGQSNELDTDFGGDERSKRMHVVFDSCIIPSSSYVVNVVMFAFGFMYYCSTYSFSSLFLFLMSFSFNLTMHMLVFYPALLLRTGTIW